LRYKTSHWDKPNLQIEDDIPRGIIANANVRIAFERITVRRRIIKIIRYCEARIPQRYPVTEKDSCACPPYAIGTKFSTGPSTTRQRFC
jgi:hypothetical protein